MTTTRARGNDDHQRAVHGVLCGFPATLAFALALTAGVSAGACGGGGGGRTDSSAPKVDGAANDGIAPGVAFCGNGVRDIGEACEGMDGCGPGTRCAADCICAALASQPTTSQGLIAQALAKGAIDYPSRDPMAR